MAQFVEYDHCIALPFTVYISHTVTESQEARVDKVKKVEENWEEKQQGEKMRKITWQSNNKMKMV